jgi:hypothetical protein
MTTPTPAPRPTTDAPHRVVDRTQPIGPPAPAGATPPGLQAFERRLRRICADARLQTPADWISVDADGTVRFTDLDLRAADRFLLALEELVEHQPSRPVQTTDHAAIFEPFPAPTAHLEIA